MEPKVLSMTLDLFASMVIGSLAATAALYMIGTWILTYRGFLNV